MASWNRGFLAVSVGVTAIAAGSAQTRLWDAAKFGTQNGDYSSNLTVETVSSVDGETGIKARFNGQYAQIGQQFSAPVDWSACDGFSAALTNYEDFPVELGVRLDRDAAGSNRVVTIVKLRPHETLRYYMDLRPSQQGTFMRMPLPVMNSFYRHQYGSQAVSLPSVYRWQLYYRGTAPASVGLAGLYGHSVGANSIQIDGYGQLTNRGWQGKTSGPADLATQRFEEDQDLANAPDLGETDGSHTLPATTGTGKWRTYKAASGNWYFVTPQGRFFWSFGMTSVAPKAPTVVQGREAMFNNLPALGSPQAQFYGTTTRGASSYKTFDFYGANLYGKYGDAWYANWVQTTGTRLRSWGINTLGSGSDLNQLSGNTMPFTLTKTTAAFPTRLTPATTYWYDLPDVYASNFRSWMVSEWKSELQWYSKNSSFMGLYVDGEHYWGVRGGTLREKYQLPLAAFASEGTKPSKIELVRQLTVKYVTIQAFNTAYGTSYASWAALKADRVNLTDAQLTSGVVSDLSNFLRLFAQTYYSKVKGALADIGCTALFLGSKDNIEQTPDEVFASMAKSVDVISLTLYNDSANVNWAFLNTLTKPVLLSEFSFMSRDRNSSAGCFQPTIEAADQAARASMASTYLSCALAQKNVVGAHWYTYVDQPVSGRAQDGENYAFGSVDITDRPHSELTAVFRGFATQMYSLRKIR